MISCIHPQCKGKDHHNFIQKFKQNIDEQLSRHKIPDKRDIHIDIHTSKDRGLNIAKRGESFIVGFLFMMTKGLL